LIGETSRDFAMGHRAVGGVWRKERKLSRESGERF
jgi:hypothetical protein